jgi:hypothetical protein
MGACAAALVSVASVAAAPSGPLMAGVGKADITPGEKDLNPGDVILDHLFARALVVRNGTNCAVLVGLDQGGIRDNVAKPATARIAEITGCAPDNVIISATHTHSGSTGGLGGRGEPNARKIEDGIVAAVQTANASVRPARIGYTTANVDLNINRDLFVDNRWVQGPNPNGVSDKTMAVVEFIDQQGMPIGVYMNYAMHPVDFYHSGVISGDFAGEASRYVERQFGRDMVAVFVQGASGNQNPRLQRPERQLIRVRTHSPLAADQSVTAPPPWAATAGKHNPVNDDDTQMKIPISPSEKAAYKDAIDNTAEISAAMGTIIGETTIQAMHDLDTLSDRASISGANATLQCPGRDRLDRDNPIREGALPPYADGDPVTIKVGVLRLGDIYISSVNGEVYNDIAVRLKKEAPVGKLMMTTLANGAANSGYIYSNEAGSHLTFQVIGSRLKPQCAEDKIVDTALTLIKRLE